MQQQLQQQLQYLLQQQQQMQKQQQQIQPQEVQQPPQQQPPKNNKNEVAVNRELAGTTSEAAEDGVYVVARPVETALEAAAAAEEAEAEVASPLEAWTASLLLSPLPASPTHPVSRETQTLPPSRVHRGTQAGPPSGIDQASQSDSDWEPPTRASSTQTDPEVPEQPSTPNELHKASSTGGRKTPKSERHEQPATPSKRPKASSINNRKAATKARRAHWGPLRHTHNHAFHHVEGNAAALTSPCKGSQTALFMATKKTNVEHCT
ncbi:putative uncharacterized protein DDB_G0294196 [Polyergus mexicanus]|uniref:putative uncharacterized protein DDB_G0294196 n=1 Tax=Polyergus mexicanus TaxID=615972 RepID=UPI0038B633F8